MTRLIDAEALKAELLERYSEDDSRISEIACETIDNAPTISPYKAIHDELHKGEEE